MMTRDSGDRAAQLARFEFEGAHCAYSFEYLEGAMLALAEFFDYAVNDYGAEADEVADLFEMSGVARALEVGAPWASRGKSGFELFCEMSAELGYAGARLELPACRIDKTPEYWAGWVCAYAQWRLDLSFERLFEVIPLEKIVQNYHPWHEASEEWFAAEVERRMVTAHEQTQLARLRRAAGLSQRELAYRSGVSLRSIQMYEQRNKDINRAQFGTVRELARAIGCPIEALFEPRNRLTFAA